MARTIAELPPGTRITDYITSGETTKTFPHSIIEPVLSKTGTASVRQCESCLLIVTSRLDGLQRHQMPDETPT